MSQLTYKRRFVLQSCHFNSQETYDKYERAIIDSDDPVEVIRLLQEVLLDIHGHNFGVMVTGSREVEANDDGVVVWDEELEKLVREWDRCNLSVHPDLKGFRATTEVLCMLLKEKLEKKWSNVDWTVQIWETDEIMAGVS